MGSQSIFQPRSVVLLCLVAALFPSTAGAQTLATTVPLVLPSAIAFDAQGNLYIAETANHVIRKVDGAGHISVMAGTGTQGFSGDGGPASAALLDSPQGLAADAHHLYIADTHNHRIRKVDLGTETITTIAGNSSAGSDGDTGLASAATLDAPTAIALDNKGNLYVADMRSHRIRKISATTGVITTVAGNGTQGFDGDGVEAVASLIDSPAGLAVDSSGNLYISDSHNYRVRRINAATGEITTVAGTGSAGFSGDSGAATAAALALPQGLSVDQQGIIYLADSANHRLRRIDVAQGKISTIAGVGTQGFAGDGGPAVAASLDSPRSVTVNAGSVVVADTGNRRIRTIASDGSLQTVAGLGAPTPGAIVLSGSPVVSYGTGHLVATLNSATPATGSVTFLDSNGAMANVPLSSNVASLDTSSLPVGHMPLPRPTPAILHIRPLRAQSSALRSARFRLLRSSFPSPLHTGSPSLLLRAPSTVCSPAINRPFRPLLSLPPPLCRRPVPMQLRSLSQEPAQGITLWLQRLRLRSHLRQP